MLRIFDLHNVCRCMHDVRLLESDCTIAATAHPWADNDVYEQSSGDLGKQGSEHCVENLAWGHPTRTELDSTQAWYDEIANTHSGSSLVTGIYSRIRTAKWWVTAPKKCGKVRTDSDEASVELPFLIWKLTTGDVVLFCRKLPSTVSPSPSPSLSLTDCVGEALNDSPQIELNGVFGIAPVLLWLPPLCERNTQRHADADVHPACTPDREMSQGLGRKQFVERPGSSVRFHAEK